MYEMYCGKDCQICPYREATGCDGCRSQTQHCEIARCCLGKGHRTCDTCDFRHGCGKLRSKEHVPVYRQREKERLAAKEAEVARKAGVMGKWMWLMLWMNVPSLIISLLGEIESLATIAEIGGAVCSLVVCWMLLQLKAVNVDYSKAAIYTAIGIVLNLVATFINSDGLSLLVLLPAGVLALMGSYTEYQTHGDEVGAVDAALGERWRKLWKWQIIAIGGMVGSVIVMLIVPLLGALVMIAGAIASVVVSIMTIVNLYKSAQLFRKMTA